MHHSENNKMHAECSIKVQHSESFQAILEGNNGKKCEQIKIGHSESFRPLWLEKMRKSAKQSKLGIPNKMPECRFPHTTRILVPGCIPVKITKHVLSAQALCSGRVLCAEVEAKRPHFVTTI